MTSSDVVLFLLWSLVTAPSFMSISWLVLELWQFFFIRDWPEIRKLEMPSSEFCPISEDWDKLEIPNLARMSLIKCYWMLQNTRITVFTVFELLRENQQGIKLSPLPLRLGLKDNLIFVNNYKFCCWLVWDPPLFLNYVSESHFFHTRHATIT